MKKPYETPFEANRHVVIYHGDADGFCGAALMWDALINSSVVTDVQLYPAQYGEPLPEDLNKNDVVYLVDFSYKRDVMYELCQKVKFVFVLDHHKTAKEELTQLKLTDVNNVEIFFDMDRSGAMLAYDFIQSNPTIDNEFLPVSKSAPNLVKYVQDRDLWKFELPRSREINAFLRSVEFNINAWLAMLTSFEDPVTLHKCAVIGEAILNVQEIQIASAVKHAADINFPLFPGDKLGEDVKILNTTVYHSEIGEALCTEYLVPFAVTWFQRADGRFVYSLRSRGVFDVSRVARDYGGGGHPSAAGFVSDSLIEGT